MANKLKGIGVDMTQLQAS